MSEYDSTPSVVSENSQREPALAAQPKLPIERRSVRWTILVLAVVSVAAIVWSGRTTLWPEPEPDFVRPAVLLQIDINQASDREFALLPDVGPVLASRIVDDRERNGKFASIKDLARVHGIGQKTIAQIAVYCQKVGASDELVVLADD